VSVGCFRRDNGRPSNCFAFGDHRPPLQKNVRIVKNVRICDSARSANSRRLFFNGDAADAVEHISRHGGSVAAPAARQGDLTNGISVPASDPAVETFDTAQEYNSFVYGANLNTFCR